MIHLIKEQIDRTEEEEEEEEEEDFVY